MTDPDICLETLTPLWSGGSSRRCDRVHETGLIGSLRWWYEAILRGLGGWACDPSAHTCLYDPQEPHNGLCPACQAYGATGWARRFRLVAQGTTHDEGPTGEQTTSGSRFKPGSTTEQSTRPVWYFSNGPGRGGTVSLTVIPLATEFDPRVILGPLQLIERHASLAAKTQLGYGWMHFTSEQTPAFAAAQFASGMHAIAAAHPCPNSGLPALDEMFFAQVKSPDGGITATLNLRYDLREAFRSAFSGDQTLRHFICGVVKGKDRQASKFCCSQEVNGIMRVWGWIPHELPVQGVTRDQVVNEVWTTIAKCGRTIQGWREFNSSRDTVSPGQTDRVAFLASLLQ